MNTRLLSASFIFILGILFLSISFSIAEPSGATLTVVKSERTSSGAASNVSAIAGNITLLDVYSGTSVTPSWQGYYGNVSGGLRLGDASDNILYNWSVSSPSGEIYAANQSSINWTNISCFDLSLNGDALETYYNIDNTDVDGVNETFTLNNHPEFFTNSVQFTAGSCNNTLLYNSSGVGTFHEVLMTDGSYSTQVIFASILQDSNDGFDNTQVDFEMIVLEDGHGADTATSTYFFFLEIE